MPGGRSEKSGRGGGRGPWQLRGREGKGGEGGGKARGGEEVSDWEVKGEGECTVQASVKLTHRDEVMANNDWAHAIPAPKAVDSLSSYMALRL